MNTKFTLKMPLAVSINPFTGYKSEFYSFDDFEHSCIDLHNFKIKPETYIHPEYIDYDCEECSVIPYVNPKNLSEIIGYAINGNVKKYDIDQTPHKLLDSKKVAWVVGTTGVFSCNTDKVNIPYVLGTDNLDIFINVAKAGETVVFHEDIDQAYQLINDGMPETIFRAMTGFNQPKQNQDLFVKLDESFNALQSKQIKKFLLEKIDEVKHTITSETFIQNPINQWGELVPLQVASLAKAAYPIDTLPSLVKEAAIAISEHVQAPIAMTAQCVIGAISHIAQARVNAPNKFIPQGEPCSLYLLTEGQSGSRKSTSRNMADQAILQHERKRYELYRHELEQWKSGHAGLNKKDREAYLTANPPPQDPSTLFSDITLESIAGLYIDGILNNASIASDEAGQFFGGYTMKGDSRNQAIGGYAKLFDDGFVERTRSKSNLNGSGRAYDVRLTFNLQGQHEVLADALKDSGLRGQGFLPRFILTVPENLAGTRLQDEAYRAKNANTDHRLLAYWARCKYLLDEYPRPLAGQEQYNGRYVIPMNGEAKKINDAFYDLFESMQGAGKRYEYLQEFASRASQLARRLATVFAYFEGLPYIDAKTLKGACEVVKHSLNEWASYADIEVKTESDAQRLIKWLIGKCVQQKTNKLTYSYMQTSCPRPMQKNKNILEMIIQQLEDSNHIKVESLGRTRYVVINPILLES
jgi:hypothetical protein